MIEKLNKPLFALRAIVLAPVAIMLVSKFYHFIWDFMFPCITSYCSKPFTPGFLSFVTAIALVGYGIYYFAHES